ncbi:MAG: type II secretion system protein D [Henriciella sp.]
MKRSFYAPLSILALTLSSCASGDKSGTLDTSEIPQVRPQSQVSSVSSVTQNEAELLGEPVPGAEASNGELRFGTVPRIGTRQPIVDASGPSYPPLPSGDLEISLSASQSIPEFIDIVFGDILGTGYSLGPGVDSNPGVVNLRTPSEMSPKDLYDTAVNTLQLHAISVAFEEGEVKIYADENLRESAPRFIPSRARSSVPAGLQPIVQYVEIYARDLNDMAQILKDAFPDSNDLTVRVNRASNSLTIAGLPQQASEALKIIEEMDELDYADTEYAVYTARNWSAEELGKALEELLILNGLSVSSQRGVTASINLKTIDYTQQVYIFARRPDFLDLAIRTIRMLDADASPDDQRTTRVYKAKHYKAEDLVQVLDSVAGLSQPAIGAQDTAGLSTPVASGGGEQAVASTGNYVVDLQGNRIIFQATNDEYADTLKLLNQIDVPASEVLIEVTIAEVTLTDQTRSGVEFIFNQIGSRGFAVDVGTLGGLGLASGGLSGGARGGDYILDFSAFASNNDVNVLSTPRIVTKSGSSASIQVGTDVPLIISQSAGASQSEGTTDILQTVQYRETGILLDITPLVLSEDRIDLTISQEVSSAEDNENQSIASPLISNRSLQTELTLQDGQSAILGGLIENRYSRGISGVPLLKDIPGLGRAFSTETLNNSQTVLMVMITPYVLNSREDRASAVNALADRVNDAYLQSFAGSKTFIKPTAPLQVSPQPEDSSSDGESTIHGRISARTDF